MTTTAEWQDGTRESRQRMIEQQLRRRGITDERVLAAMAAVPREAFVSEPTLKLAYEDTPLPIEHGQTISQPYIVALMAEALKLAPGDVVLEVGAGSGYAAAVLSMIAGKVYAIERVPQLCETARERLGELGFRQVEIKCGDGTLGWREHAPYQAIVCAASGPTVPTALLEQLDICGRLVMPVDRNDVIQRLVRITQVRRGEYETEDLGAVRFVPLIGEQGWSA